MSDVVARRMVVTGVAMLTVGALALAGSEPTPAHAEDNRSQSVTSTAADGPDDPPPPVDPAARPAGPPAVADPTGPPARATPKRSGTAPVTDPSGPPPDADPTDTPDGPTPAAPGPVDAASMTPVPPKPEAPSDLADPDAPKPPDPAAPKPPDPDAPKPPDPAAPRPPDPAAPKPPAEPRKPEPAVPTEAAERYGWGAPGAGSDEFDYTGAPDPTKWSQAGECWPGHAGNGGRCASKSRVDGSKLVQTGAANGDTGWLASRTNQRYGRWEARVRSEATGKDNGRQYHPLLIIWPESDRWPEDGEYDFLENGAPGERCAESFIHYPHSPGPTQQIFTREKDCGAPLSEWHNIAFEWTPDHVRGFIDGEQWFSYSGGARGGRRAIQDMPSGHLTIQLDNFFGGNMQPAVYEVDWVRTYPLRQPGSGSAEDFS